MAEHREGDPEQAVRVRAHALGVRGAVEQAALGHLRAPEPDLDEGVGTPCCRDEAPVGAACDGLDGPWKVACEAHQRACFLGTVAVTVVVIVAFLCFGGLFGPEFEYLEACAGKNEAGGVFACLTEEEVVLVVFVLVTVFVCDLFEPFEGGYAELGTRDVKGVLPLRSLGGYRRYCGDGVLDVRQVYGHFVVFVTYRKLHE